MTESKLRDISTDFAVKIIKLCETIKGHYSLVNQLERYQSDDYYTYNDYFYQLSRKMANK